MEEAPFFAELANGPEGGAAWWLQTEDGIRIRIGLWNRAAPGGTVLLFPGRTEYIEKYGHTARQLAERGFATLAVDWRGQGIADRLIKDPATGHVHDFLDYQKDVKAMLEAASELGLPQPFYLLAHSMGGCIGLRALHEGLPVCAAVFTGPMWNIQLAATVRPFARALARVGTLFGFGQHYAPGTNAESYVATAPFEDNSLTRDRATWDYMKSHLSAHPEFCLGGPSLRWLDEALHECGALLDMPAPKIPALAFLGDNERIVDSARVHTLMDRWPNGELIVVENGEHEVLMDTPATQTMIFDKIAALFSNNTTPPRTAEPPPAPLVHPAPRPSRFSPRYL
ncbi:alpha/beta fold hydrolase [Aquicoccus sp. G2-2]|uniref:alpha/beta hydrolase n=1 Tax=Aquicoccus sp. G2-2 TaxID=3092120 RepID=UPI002ADFBACD|nr:alpha/beta hydrolase [Aquicoccus sp. G2-2]MEA1114335.1 alpha/beta hydrolase [Aquicoccus sp. G2-2]